MISSSERSNPMTQTQIKEYLANAQEVKEKATVSKTEARKLLAKAGFCTQKGELKKIYRQE